jgi:hypothetical protein
MAKRSPSIDFADFPEALVYFEAINVQYQASARQVVLVILLVDMLREQRQDVESIECRTR